MKHPVKSAALSFVSVAGLLAGTGFALAAVTVGDELGTTEDDIRAALTAEGYTVEEIETEEGEIEAEVSLDGKEMDVVVDAKSGLVLELELDDEDEDDEMDDD